MKIINNIYIQSGLMANKKLLATIVNLNNIVIITDDLVPKKYVENLYYIFDNAAIELIMLNAGESNKNLLAIESIINKLITFKSNKAATIIALGGGVVGDLAGFAAAIYMRGINWIQIPTTMIAQVDSAYGGKTGCNYKNNKNLLGAFYDPKIVLVDPQYLQSLSMREYTAGLAEVIKYGMACDEDFFEWIDAHKNSIKKRDTLALQIVVEKCCEIKTNIVIKDPKDQHERMLLNFGHSFGHALEVATGFTVYLHGEAVAIGMLLATLLAVKIGMLERGILNRLRNLLEYFELPIDVPPISSLTCYMGGDKKNCGDTLKLVLPYAIGKAKIISSVSLASLEDLLQNYAE